MAKSTDHWKDSLTQGKISRLHLLEPTSLQVKAALCVVDDDPRLPKTRIHAKISNVGVSVTEQKVLDALSLATSIPLPEGDAVPMALNKVCNVTKNSHFNILWIIEKISLYALHTNATISLSGVYKTQFGGYFLFFQRKRHLSIPAKKSHLLDIC